MTGEKQLYPLGDTDYAVAPGETLRELLEEKGISQRELARRADLSPKHVNKLLQGLVPLSADVAMRLERVTGTPARIWNRLEADYRSDLERIRSREELVMDVAWADDFPMAELVKLDHLPAQPADKVSRLEQVLAFFGVASVGAWDEVYAELACAFRTTQAFENERGALAAWLRLGELAAHDVECAEYDRRKLEAALPALRQLTREPVEVFCERVRAICADCGVAVVFVPELPGSWASGVARWLTSAKALIQLSLRYKTDDHLCFTFFHEIGHVLRHGKTDVWIEASSSSGTDDQLLAACLTAHRTMINGSAPCTARRSRSVLASGSHAGGSHADRRIGATGNCLTCGRYCAQIVRFGAGLSAFEADGHA